MEDHGTALEGHHFNEFNPGIGITRKLGQTLLLKYNCLCYLQESSKIPRYELGCADPDQPCRLPNSFKQILP